MQGEKKAKKKDGKTVALVAVSVNRKRRSRGQPSPNTEFKHDDR